jgi:hypothetical protein
MISTKLYRNLTVCAILLKDGVREFLKFWKRAIIYHVQISIVAYSVFYKEKQIYHFSAYKSTPHTDFRAIS